MEQSSVTLDVFEAITIQGSVSIPAIFTLTRGRMFLMAITALYAVFFQTLSSAMTGYSGESWATLPCLGS